MNECHWTEKEAHRIAGVYLALVTLKHRIEDLRAVQKAMIAAEVPPVHELPEGVGRALDAALKQGEPWFMRRASPTVSPYRAQIAEATRRAWLLYEAL